MYLSVVLWCSLGVLGVSQPSDYQLIEQTVQYYLEGDSQKDFQTVSKAFHPESLMMHVSREGQYQTYEALEVFRGQEGREPETNRSHQIAFMDVFGNAAVAKVVVTYPRGQVTDYLSLLKIEGQWQIVNKTYAFQSLLTE
ncbi:MAG: nuclear transport factor 2 family protein [Bacteroidota bacterium]